MSKGKRYTEEFKREAVKQVVERGYSVAEVADRLGICTKTLYQWRSDMHGTSQQIKSADDKAELARLKAELKRVTEERDILKKAAKYFANNPD
mgnify:FL=1|tara:strand:- start:4396 stop:4674 length:279 start_codon:yes stop_codon:yes gene_type:complete